MKKKELKNWGITPNQVYILAMLELLCEKLNISPSEVNNKAELINKIRMRMGG